MSKTYTLLCNGRQYDGVTADEAKRLLIVGGYSYHYVDQLVRDTLPTIEETDWLSRANSLCQRAEATVKEIRELCDSMEEEFKLWFSSKKSGSAQKGAMPVESASKSLPQANTAQKSKPAKRP